MNRGRGNDSDPSRVRGATTSTCCAIGCLEATKILTIMHSSACSLLYYQITLSLTCRSLHPHIYFILVRCSPVLFVGLCVSVVGCIRPPRPPAGKRALHAATPIDLSPTCDPGCVGSSEAIESTKITRRGARDMVQFQWIAG